MQAVAYLRRSRVDARKPGTLSYEDQVAAVRRLAEQHGDDPDALVMIEDWGKSGRAAKQHLRSGFTRLEAMVRDGQVSAIYALSANRLARSLEALARLAKACEAAGVPIRCADGYSPDVSTSTGRMVLGILGSVYAWQAEWTAERMTEVTEMRRRRGDHMGPAPYGSRVVKGVLVEDASEQPDVVVDAYRRAGTIQGAARLLNAEGVPTRRGGKWRASSLKPMLERVAPDMLPRTMSRGRPPAGAFRFVGLLRCPCGATLTGRHYRGALAAYTCQRSRTDPDHPRPTTVSESQIAAWLEAEAGRLQVPASAVEMSEDESRRDDLEGRRRRVLDNYEDGYLDRAARDAKVAEIVAELERLAQRRMVEAVPDAIDWTWAPEKVNAVLRALWDHVDLDADLRPVGAVWRVPEWRSADEAAVA
jgi:DNA invertase Pin-like site-specific DNA recombinase